MIDPTLCVLKPWDTDPKRTAKGFITGKPECLHNYQKECLQKLRILTIDHSEEYLGQHPQVEALIRILIGSLATKQPADAREFIRSVLTQSDLESDVAKVVALELDCNNEHSRRYWTKFPFWQELTKTPGPLYHNRTKWPRARPDRYSETVSDQQEYGGYHTLRAPGLFFPTEMMVKKFEPEKDPSSIEEADSDNSDYQKLLESDTDSDGKPKYKIYSIETISSESSEKLSPKKSSEDISSSINMEPCQDPEHKESIPSFAKSLDDSLRELDEILSKSEEMLNKLKEKEAVQKSEEFEEEEEEVEEEEDEESLPIGFNDYETRVKMKVKIEKKNEIMKSEPLTKNDEVPEKNSRKHSMILIASSTDSMGRIISPDKNIVNSASGALISASDNNLVGADYTKAEMEKKKSIQKDISKKIIKSSIHTAFSKTLPKGDNVIYSDEAGNSLKDKKFSMIWIAPSTDSQGEVSRRSQYIVNPSYGTLLSEITKGENGEDESKT